MVYLREYTKKSTKFSGMLGEDERMIPEKKLLKNLKQRPSKFKKGYSQDLVKQTVIITFAMQRKQVSTYICIPGNA